MTPAEETEQVRRFYDRIATRYDRGIRLGEWVLFKEGRRWAAAQARGETLEIGIGTGRNLPYYPAEVRLTGIDVSPAMLELARERARQLNRPVELRAGDAQALDFPAASFDTVVSTLSLCTIPDPAQAVREAARVLRPGGRLILLEHVRSPLLPVRVIQRLLEPITVRLEHDHLLREPLEYVEAAGLVVEQLERSRLGLVERLVARKPE
ncbi:class I SAM-dependent methyltransferase [Thermalbibacter longus]|uniref:class I SAM-dependent methyltransferase n=1 Tax=Thermalbibacter longus TaxID=2951981 RepID=UPI003D3619AC